MKKTVYVFAYALLFSAAAFATDIQGSFFVNGGFSAGAFQPHFINKMDNTFLMGGRIQADYALKRYLSLGLEAGYNTAQVENTDFSIGAIPILARNRMASFCVKQHRPIHSRKSRLWFKPVDDRRQ
jgi:hypothetical protein